MLIDIRAGETILEVSLVLRGTSIAQSLGRFPDTGRLSKLTQLQRLRLWGMFVYVGHLPELGSALLDGQWQAGRSSIKRDVRISGLKYLSRLTGIRELRLNHPKLKDAALKHLAGLTQLRILDLESTSVTDAGLEHLAGLTQLRSLDLGSTRVKGEGLKYLAGLIYLDELVLNNTDVTDAGLEYLAGLKQLQELKLHGTEVTDAGVQRLQRALPECDMPYLGMP
jgi:Leucine rich repeat